MKQCDIHGYALAQLSKSIRITTDSLFFRVGKKDMSILVLKNGKKYFFKLAKMSEKCYKNK